MNTTAQQDERSAHRALTIWNLTVISALIAFMGLTWWTQPTELWSLQTALQAKDDVIAPDRITVFQNTQPVTVTLNSQDGKNEQKTVNAIYLSPGQTLSGFYIHADELALPEEGDVELQFAYNTNAAGKLLLDWLPIDNIQNPPGAQTQNILFGDDVRGYIATSHLGPFPAEALRNNGLRVLLSSPQPVSCIEIALFETSDLLAWKRAR